MAFDGHGELAIGLCKGQDEQSGPRTTIHALATKRAEIGRIYGVGLIFGPGHSVADPKSIDLSVTCRRGARSMPSLCHTKPNSYP